MYALASTIRRLPALFFLRRWARPGSPTAVVSREPGTDSKSLAERAPERSICRIPGAEPGEERRDQFPQGLVVWTFVFPAGIVELGAVHPRAKKIWSSFLSPGVYATRWNDGGCGARHFSGRWHGAVRTSSGSPWRFLRRGPESVGRSRKVADRRVSLNPHPGCCRAGSAPSPAAVAGPCTTPSPAWSRPRPGLAARERRCVRARRRSGGRTRSSALRHVADAARGQQEVLAAMERLGNAERDRRRRSASRHTPPRSTGPRHRQAAGPVARPRGAKEAARRVRGPASGPTDRGRARPSARPNEKNSARQVDVERVAAVTIGADRCRKRVPTVAAQAECSSPAGHP